MKTSGIPGGVKGDPVLRETREKLTKRLTRRFSNVIVAQQIKRKMTADNLAKKLGIGSSPLSWYKKRRHLPSLSEFVRIMDVLGVDPMIVLDLTDKHLALHKELSTYDRASLKQK